MRPLYFNNETDQRINEVLAWAKENIYRPGMSEMIPGDDPRHVVEIFQGFRCVFSFTEDPGGLQLFRHLSISIPGPRYPHPIAAYTIATKFGFTGWQMEMGEMPAPDWLMDINKGDHCIVLAQAMPSSESR